MMTSAEEMRPDLTQTRSFYGRKELTGPSDLLQCRRSLWPQWDRSPRVRWPSTTATLVLALDNKWTVRLISR